MAALVGAAWLAERRGCWVPHPQTDGYDRSSWAHWVDDDEDCQDTRDEVLAAESLVPVTFVTSKRCKVRRGRWRCPYTGKRITDPHQLDIDHLVPLHEAHRSGAASWSPSRKRDYANALGDEAHLIAVDRGANRSKGDRDPSAWMPAEPRFRCTYLRAWTRIKARWSLAMDDAEHSYVERSLRACADGVVPSRPSP